MKTKRSLVWLLVVVTLCSFLSLNVLAQDKKPVQKKHAPITQRLITMVEHNSEIKKLLIESIEKAKIINPDSVTNPAQTLEEYYATSVADIGSLFMGMVREKSISAFDA